MRQSAVKGENVCKGKLNYNLIVSNMGHWRYFFNVSKFNFMTYEVRYSFGIGKAKRSRNTREDREKINQFARIPLDTRKILKQRANPSKSLLDLRQAKRFCLMHRFYLNVPYLS